jgi:hypothetical protein
MSFFIRIWLQGDEVPFINAREHEITHDMAEISPATVIDAEVEGSYLDAGTVRAALTVVDGVLHISGRNVLWQQPSSRP